MALKMNNISKLLLFLFLLAACSVSDEEKATLLKAERQLKENPDSALITLEDSTLQVGEWSKRGRMKHSLLLTRAKNSTDRPLRSDSAFREVVDYYDAHGSDNERMLAHYLLGCIYRGSNDAPQAIQCYNDAVDCADTLNADCDYGVLYRIYGQMAEVYADQFLYEEALNASDKYSYYAYKDWNMYDYLRGQEQKIPIYYSLGDISTVLKQTEQSVMLYKKYDMPRKAASAYYSAMYVYMNQGQYQKVHELMTIFETQSDVFDENHDIERGREDYYYLKGWYFQSINNIDSAEYYYRKLLAFTIHDYEASRGLLNVYKSRQNTDSIIKYADLCECALDSLLSNTSTLAVANVKGLYDYCRYQKIAKEKSLEVQKAWFIAFALAALCVCAAIVSYLVYRNYQHRKLMEISVMASNYNEAKASLEKAKTELDLMEANNQAFRNDKEKEIRLLQEKVDNYEKQYEEIVKLEEETIVLDSDIVKTFRIMSRPKRNASSPSDIDWEKLLNTVKNGLPSFYAFITDKFLSEMELYICILVRLDFSSKEIALLLNTTPQVVTNTKAKANHKLFGEAGASSLRASLKNLKAQE